MRLGVSTDFESTNCEQWMKNILDLQLKTVVFPLNCEDEEAKIDEYCRAAKEAGITIAEVGIWRNAIDANEDVAKENLKYSIKQLALAEKIGARCCVNVAGAFSGDRWDGPTRDNFSKDAWKKTVKMIQTIIDEVNPKNTYFSIEPMPWMIPTGPEEYLNLIEDVARDRFAVHMDIINMITSPRRYFFPEEFMEKSFELLKGKIRSCHMKDIGQIPEYTFQVRECAPGEGVFPLERYVELATAEDANMPMIIEHLHTNEEYQNSVAYVRQRLSKGGIIL